MLEAALRKAGITADILDLPETGVDQELDRIANAYDLVVAAGGDGTVSSVAAAVARAGKALSVIPSGTLNHFARDAGIPTDLDEAVARIRDGAPRAMDVGTVNDHVFLNNVSLGNYPRMVDERERLERSGRSRHSAAVIAAASTWWHLRDVSASLDIDGRQEVHRSPFILIGNGTYVMSGLAAGRRDEISDHRLSLYVVPRLGRLGALSLPMRALLGTLERDEQFESVSATKITIAVDAARVRVAIDGDPRELESPLRFAIKPGALQVV